MIELDLLRRRLRHARTVGRLRREADDARREGLRVVHMLHIGKTGGTAVKAVLLGQSPPGTRLMLHHHGVSLADLPADDDVFFFLRDPVTRFVSGFESRRREGRPAHYHPWSPAERAAFGRFPSAEALALALGASDPVERTRAAKAMNGITHVRSRLADWLVDEDLVRARRERIVFVGWQESLDVDFARLVELLGLAPGTKLPRDEAAAHRAPERATARELSIAAAAPIRAWYAGDYRFIDLLVKLGLTADPAASA